MKKLNLKKIVDKATYGHPDQRLAAARNALVILLNYLRWLANNLKQQRSDFRRTLEAWEARYINEELTPYAIQHDVDQGRKIRLYAWIAVLAELCLSFFLALTFGVPVLFALTMAIVAIYITKAVLMSLWSNRLQPQEQIQRLRNFIIAPFGLIMFVSLAVLLLGQRGTGGLLLLLAGLLNASLFGVSFGLLLVASGLLCYAEVLLWSQRAERRYQQLYTEAAETNKVYEYVQRVIQELTPPTPPAIPATPNKADFNHVPDKPDFINVPAKPIKQAQSLVRSVMPLLLGAALLSSACQSMPDGFVKPKAEPTAAAAVTAAAATEMQVFVDGSFSNHPQILEDTVKQLVGELAQLIESQHITHFVSFFFGRDGWAATKTLELDLPSLQTTERSEAGDVFGRLRQEQQAELLKNYRDELQAKLRGVTATRLLPPAGTPEPPCTDLNGVFARLAAARGKQRRLTVVISDGHESCAASLRPVKLPTRTRLIIVLLAEDPQKTGAQPQYLLVEERRRQLQQALPQAVIVTPFDKLLEVVESAGTN